MYTSRDFEMNMFFGKLCKKCKVRFKSEKCPLCGTRDY